MRRQKFFINNQNNTNKYIQKFLPICGDKINNFTFTKIYRMFNEQLVFQLVNRIKNFIE